MMTAPARHESFFCDTTFIKQEPVEAEPHTSPKQEIEYVSVKEETLVEAELHTSPKQEIEYISVKEETPCLRDWEVPDGHDSVRDPLSVDKKENSPSEDFPTSSTLNIEKTEDEEEEEKAMTKDSGEECSSSEEFLEPSVFHVEKTEDEEGDESVSEDDFEELKHGVESTSSHSEPERCQRDSGKQIARRGQSVTMAHRKLSVRERVVALIEGGKHSIRCAGRSQGVPPTTANRWWRNYVERGTAGRIPGSGRKRRSTQQEDTELVRKSRQLPFLNAKQLRRETNFPASSDTVRRRLREAEVCKYYPGCHGG
ncbi:uncharacterized protein LOC126106537 isoform X3 [Schistocerca cancellata]|uniref:uncharacterized protein LOC126106537 isoform X3 n=1 Tax=Schistocerca cancellata TaxID=274614 RepID=UPI0021195BB1|nr:uncharacterized protein LOC126106537 isoform X3 [Schistocerca cancellata]